MVDPADYAAISYINWLLFDVLSGAPLWLPAAVPSQHLRPMPAIRRISTVLLVDEGDEAQFKLVRAVRERLDPDQHCLHAAMYNGTLGDQLQVALLVMPTDLAD